MLVQLARCAALCVAMVVALPAAAQPAVDDFMIAVANDRSERVLSFLSQGIDPNVVDANGDPALLVAAREGSAATANVLLAAGAKPNVRNRFQDTPLMVAALKGHL